jgi:hypothetical protein
MDTAASRPITPFSDTGRALATCFTAASGEGRAGAAGADSVGDGRSRVGTRRTLAFLLGGGFPVNAGALPPVPCLVFLLRLVRGVMPESGIADPRDGTGMALIGSGDAVDEADGVAVTCAG